MMRWFDIARTAVRSLVARRRFDDQLDADLRFHLEQATDEYVRDGLSPDEARRAALKAFGNPTHVVEDVREVSHLDLVGTAGAGPALRAPRLPSYAGIHRDGRAVAGARDRRQHRHLQRPQRAGAASAAGSRAGHAVPGRPPGRRRPVGKLHLRPLRTPEGLVDDDRRVRSRSIPPPR